MSERSCILIVDDEAAVRRVIRTFLERSGHRVLEAASGEEALNLFQKSVSSIQLVLSDVRIPGMDGNELARRIHGIHPAQRILFITAYPGDIDESVRRFESLVKPFSGRNLLSKVNTIMAKTACSSGAAG